MTKPAKKIPSFKNEVEERKFWESHDSSEFLDWTQAKQVALPNLKPTTKTISLRLPQHLLDSIKAAANSRDVPYQSLIKVWLQEKLQTHWYWLNHDLSLICGGQGGIRIARYDTPHKAIISDMPTKMPTDCVRRRCVNGTSALLWVCAKKVRHRKKVTKVTRQQKTASKGFAMRNTEDLEKVTFR